MSYLTVLLLFIVLIFFQVVLFSRQEQMSVAGAGGGDLTGALQAGAQL